MSTAQQIEVIVLSLLFSIYVLYKARSEQLEMRYAITWLMVVAGLLFMAIFPRAVLWLAEFLGFEVGANLLFMTAIVVLSVIVFRQTVMLSTMEKRIVTLTQTVALLQVEPDKTMSKHAGDSDDGIL